MDILINPRDSFLCFVTGHRGSSVARLEEAKQRSALYAALSAVETKVKKRVKLIDKKFHDTVTYQVGVNLFIMACYHDWFLFEVNRFQFEFVFHDR